MNGRLVRREALLPGEREAMLGLLAAHFAGVTRDSFARDLAEKNWVLLLEEDGRLRGFTTLLFYRSRRPDGEPISVVYSGDTIVERGAWGSAALPKSWIAAVRALHAAAPAGPLYWLLLTSGFRTYRFLPVFWRDFVPHPAGPMPPEARELLDALARERLGSAYRPDLGVARLPRPQILAADLREVPVGKIDDPHVAFFLAANPGWAAGDELVCLTEIGAENLTAAGRRMWRDGRIEIAGDPP